MRVNVRDEKWTVRDEKLIAEHWGECSYAFKRILIDPSGGQKTRMDTLIHEMLHAINRRWTEERVTEMSRDLTEALWKDGWRRP